MIYPSNQDQETIEESFHGKQAELMAAAQDFIFIATANKLTVYNRIQKEKLMHTILDSQIKSVKVCPDGRHCIVRCVDNSFCRLLIDGNRLVPTFSKVAQVEGMDRKSPEWIFSCG